MMHQLTSSIPHRLEVYVETFDGGEPFTISYESFYVDDSHSNYILNISGYTVSSTRVLNESFINSDGTGFSTFDRDNDKDIHSNCAQKRGSGWWHTRCGKFNLNGIFGEEDVPTDTHIFIANIDIESPHPRRSKSVRFVEMKIQPVE